MAHHHPPYQIWRDKVKISNKEKLNVGILRNHDFIFHQSFQPHANCWLWSENATQCDWGGGELIEFHPGAQMIRCSGLV